MARLTPELRKKCVEFAESMKFVGGYKDYRIAIREAKRDDPESRAEIFPDPLEKVLIIQLYRGFFTLEWWQQENVILHELLHGRVWLKNRTFETLTSKIDYEVEEQMVNDLTRGFEELLGENRTLREENQHLRTKLLRMEGASDDKQRTEKERA